MQNTWPAYFSALAQIAAALSALLFLALQLSRLAWTGDFRKKVAVQTLLEFLVPLFFSLTALLPSEMWRLFDRDIMTWQVGGVVASVVGLLVAITVATAGLSNWDSIGGFGHRQVALQLLSLA